MYTCGDTGTHTTLDTGTHTDTQTHFHHHCACWAALGGGLAEAVARTCPNVKGHDSGFLGPSFADL